MNIPLFSAIFSIASTVLIGVLMIILFVNDLGNLQTVLGSVAVGFIVSIPIAWAVTKKLSRLTGAPPSEPQR